MKAKPTSIFRFVKRIGADELFIEVSVWANEVQLQNKDKVELYAVSLQRSFKQGDNWEHTTTMRPQDLLPLSHLLTKAYDFISEQ